MHTKDEALKLILDQRILPLFFHPDPAVCLQTVKTLYAAGIRTIEFTNRGEAARENFAYLKSELASACPDLHLGVGTVKTAREAEFFIATGADYIVSPIVNAEVGRVVNEAKLLWIPGCMTPTEVHVAAELGAPLVKIFPANILGPAFISSIRELFPGLLFMPTGGVEIEENNLYQWFLSGVSAVGLGSKLISKELLAAGDYQKLSALAVKALELAGAVPVK